MKKLLSVIGLLLVIGLQSQAQTIISPQIHKGELEFGCLQFYGVSWDGPCGVYELQQRADLQDGTPWTHYDTYIKRPLWNEPLLAVDFVDIFNPLPQLYFRVVFTPDADQTDCPASPISLIKQPASRSLYLDDKLVHEAYAAGPAGITYQWTKNGINVAGATNATYTVDTVTASDAGTYACQIASSAGATTATTNAAVTVIQQAMDMSVGRVTVETNTSVVVPVYVNIRDDVDSFFFVLSLDTGLGTPTISDRQTTLTITTSSRYVNVTWKGDWDDIDSSIPLFNMTFNPANSGKITVANPSCTTASSGSEPVKATGGSITVNTTPTTP